MPLLSSSARPARAWMPPPASSSATRSRPGRRPGDADPGLAQPAGAARSGDVRPLAAQPRGPRPHRSRPQASTPRDRGRARPAPRRPSLDRGCAIADRDQLDRVLARLQPEARAVVVMHFYLDLPLTRVADTLGIPLGTVKSRLHRSLGAMRSASPSRRWRPYRSGRRRARDMTWTAPPASTASSRSSSSSSRTPHPCLPRGRHRARLVPTPASRVDVPRKVAAHADSTQAPPTPRGRGVSSASSSSSESSSPGDRRVCRLTTGTRTAAPPFGLAGNGVIALAKDGDILVADRPGGDLRPLVAGPEDDRSPMFSPDGTRLAFLRDDRSGSALMVADADGTNVVQLTPEPSDAEYWSFAPDGRSLVAVGEDRRRERMPGLHPPGRPGSGTHRPGRPVAGTARWSSCIGRVPSFRPTNPQEILVVAQLDPDGPRGIYVYDLATGGIRTIVEPADDSTCKTSRGPRPGSTSSTDRARRSRVVAADGIG